MPLIWRISAAETLASMSAIAAGASLALLALNLEYNASNVIAVFNPLEKMLTFADASTADAAANRPVRSSWLLLDGIASVLARYTFVLHSSPRPTVFLTWLIVPGIVYAWPRGERQTAIQALVLLLAAIGIDTLGVRRGLKSEYFIFTDPLIILAGAILLDRSADLRFRKWTYPVAVVLFGLHIVVGQAEPIKYAFMRRGPEADLRMEPALLAAAAAALVRAALHNGLLRGRALRPGLMVDDKGTAMIDRRTTRRCVAALAESGRSRTAPGHRRP